MRTQKTTMPDTRPSFNEWAQYIRNECVKATRKNKKVKPKNKFGN